MCKQKAVLIIGTQNCHHMKVMLKTLPSKKGYLSCDKNHNCEPLLGSTFPLIWVWNIRGRVPPRNVFWLCDLCCHIICLTQLELAAFKTAVVTIII